MFTMEAADTLQAQASASTTLTMTVYGLEIASGVETFKKLYQGQPTSSAAAVYTVPGSTVALVKSIIITNPGGTDRTIKLWHDGSTDAFVVLPTQTIVAGGWAEYGDDGWVFYDASANRKVKTELGSSGALSYATTAELNGVDASAEDAGVSTTVARGDHKHLLAVAAPVASAPADTVSGGSSVSAARADHRHARENFATMMKYAID